MYNENWVYQSSKLLGVSISFMDNIGSYLFITFDNFLMKADQNMNSVSTYTTNGAIYRGIVYSDSKSLLYVAAYSLNRVDVFDGTTPLKLSRSICTNSGYINYYTIAAYGNYLYVATTSAILVYLNEVYTTVITNQYCNTYGGGSLLGLLVDGYGNMAMSCQGAWPNLYIYTISQGTTISRVGTLGLGANSAVLSFQLGIDSFGRFVAVSQTEISLFY